MSEISRKCQAINVSTVTLLPEQKTVVHAVQSCKAGHVCQRQAGDMRDRADTKKANKIEYELFKGLQPKAYLER